MARFDKADPVGTFRVRLEEAWPLADVGKVVGVGVNANGRGVRGAGQTGVKGVVALGKVRPAGHPIDPMFQGEILDMAGLAAGTEYYVNAAGDLVPDAAGNLYVGFTVEADRLVVNLGGK